MIHEALQEKKMNMSEGFDDSVVSLLDLRDTIPTRSKMLIQIGTLNLIRDGEKSKDQFLLFFFDTSFIVTDLIGHVVGMFSLIITNKDTDHVKLLVLESEFKKQKKDIAMLSLFLGVGGHIEVEQFFISYNKGELFVYDTSENILGSIDLIGKKKIMNLEFIPNDLIIAKKKKAE